MAWKSPVSSRQLPPSSTVTPPLPRPPIIELGLPLPVGLLKTSVQLGPMAAANSRLMALSLAKIMWARYECSPPEWVAICKSQVAFIASQWAAAARSVG